MTWCPTASSDSFLPQLASILDRVVVKAWLAGDNFDLQDLADLLPSGEVRVIREGDRFYLAASELDSTSADISLSEVARKLLLMVNGLARARNPSFRPAGLAERYGEDGKPDRVMLSARLEVRAQMRATLAVLGGDGDPVPQPSPGPGFMALTVTNSDVTEVLGIMGQPPSWMELYKVYEIIRHAGGLKAAMKAAAITTTSMSVFTLTANHQDASGADARHARLPQLPPIKPMTMGQAQTMIGQLVTAWMASL